MSDWEPIDDAPRDGKTYVRLGRLINGRPVKGYPTCSFTWSKEWGCWVAFNRTWHDGLKGPTHFMISPLNEMLEKERSQ